MSEESELRDWSQLNGDVLRIIAQEKLSLEDYLRFKSVCKNWKSAIDSSSSGLRRPQLPWLMLPYCQQHTTSTTTSCCRCFYSISDGKTHHIQFPAGYDDKRCVGSSHGWLIVLEETSPSIFLLNPLTNQRIELPPHSSFPDVLEFHPCIEGHDYILQLDSEDNPEEYASMSQMVDFHIAKIVLSSDPTLDGCIAVAIYGDDHRLAYCRVGQDHNWNQVHNDFTLQNDVIFWKGAFYVTGICGSLLVFDPNSNSDSLKVDVIIEFSDKATRATKVYSGSYLVADPILHQLLLIGKSIFCYDKKPYKTHVIDVYSLNEEKKLWEKRQNIGGKVLFLGYNESLCFSAADYPELKPNTIHFTDDFLVWYEKEKVGGHDVGIFDMKDGVFKPLPGCDPHTSLIWPPPIWVTPSLTATSTSST